MCAPCNAEFRAELVGADRPERAIKLAIGVVLVGAVIAAGGLFGLRVLKWILIVVAPVFAAIGGVRYRRKRQAFIDRG